MVCMSMCLDCWLDFIVPESNGHGDCHNSRESILKTKSRSVLIIYLKELSTSDVTSSWCLDNLNGDNVGSIAPLKRCCSKKIVTRLHLDQWLVDEGSSFVPAGRDCETEKCWSRKGTSGLSTRVVPGTGFGNDPKLVCHMSQIREAGPVLCAQEHYAKSAHRIELE
ncbi:hypothetical protein Tco_0600158 [Tanacetum coccineum]|uniref:Uncharacterized protein n=1 Tax=Tanacetum coccineum TaxID=301880 RepID=A0ABQ4WB31_9ASTR